MSVLAEGSDALDLRGQSVEEVARICDDDGYLHAIHVVLTDGRTLILTVWTDWRLVAELRSHAGIPDYLWPTELMKRSVIDQLTGSCSVVASHYNEMDELTQVCLSVGHRRLLNAASLRSHGCSLGAWPVSRVR